MPDQSKSQEEVKIDYDEPDATDPTPVVRLENVYGMLPRVTAAPDWVPKKYLDSFAIDTTNNLFYFYDFDDNVWLSTSSVTDAHIRSLFSATAPLVYNSSTGAFTFSGGSTNLAETFTAGEAINGGNPVSIGPYASDGGITSDASTLTSGSADGSGNFTSSGFIIASNSNLAVFLYVLTTQTISGVTAKYNGVSMTSAFSPVNNSSNVTLYGFYLANPTNGNHPFTIQGMNASEQLGYAAFSKYNVDQTTPVVQGLSKVTSSTASVSQAVTPTQNDSILLSCISNANAGVYTYTNMNQNESDFRPLATNFGFNAGDSGKLPNKNPLTVSCSRSAGTDNYLLGIMEIKPAATISYRMFKASSASASSYGYNVPWRSNNFIGFCQTTVATNGTSPVTIGGTDTNQTALLPAQPYYLADTFGNLGVTPGTITRKAGITTTSSTEILVTDVW